MSQRGKQSTTKNLDKEVGMATIQSVLHENADGVLQNLGRFFEEACKRIYRARQGKSIVSEAQDAGTTGVVTYMRDYMEKIHIQWREIENTFGIVNGETETGDTRVRFVLFLLEFMDVWKEYDKKAVPVLETIENILTQIAAGEIDAALTDAEACLTSIPPVYQNDLYAVFVLCLLECGLLHEVSQDDLPLQILLALLQFFRGDTGAKPLTKNNLMALQNDTVYICKQYSSRLALDLVGVSTLAKCSSGGGKRSQRTKQTRKKRST